MATEKQLTLWCSVGLPNSSWTYITRSEMASYVRKPKRDSSLPVSNFRLRTENRAYLWKNPGYTTGNVMMQVLFLPLLLSIANNKLFQFRYTDSWRTNYVLLWGQRQKKADWLFWGRKAIYLPFPSSCFSTNQLFRSFSIFGFSHHKDRELMYSTTKLRDSTSEMGRLIRSLLYYWDAFNFPLACFYFSSTTPTAPSSTRVGITQIFN